MSPTRRKPPGEPAGEPKEEPKEEPTDATPALESESTPVDLSDETTESFSTEPSAEPPHEPPPAEPKPAAHSPEIEAAELSQAVKSITTEQELNKKLESGFRKEVKRYQNLARFFRTELGRIAFPDGNNLNGNQRTKWIELLNNLKSTYLNDARTKNKKKNEFIDKINNLLNSSDIENENITQLPTIETVASVNKPIGEQSPTLSISKETEPSETTAVQPTTTQTEPQVGQVEKPEHLIIPPNISNLGFTSENLVDQNGAQLTKENFDKLKRAVFAATKLGRNRTCQVLQLQPINFQRGSLPTIGIQRLIDNVENLEKAWNDDATSPSPESMQTEPKKIDTTDKPSPAELPPVEPAPTDEPPPATPETASTTQETPPPPPVPETRGRWKSITSSFKSAYDRFMSKFRGEVQPQDEKEYKASWGDVAKNAATGFLSVAASYTGVKIIADLPQWLYQKYWTNAERQRIKDALAAKETELGETTEPTTIEQKKAKLEEAINASKFLSKEKKTELLGRLHATVDEYEAKDKTLRTERNEKIAKLLDQAIETRVKNTQVLKEALNSALMVTGLSAMRGVAYGAVAVYERHQEVMQSPERRMQYWKEMTYRGFTETAHNLIGGKADTWKGKGFNFVKGATNLLRVAGFANLAYMEIAGEGFWSAANPVEQLEKLVQNAEEKGLKQTLIDNILAQWKPITSAVKTSVDWVGGPGTSANLSERLDLGESDVSGDLTSTDTAAAGAAGAAGVVAAESAPSIEIPETIVEAGLVKKGDGILKILERQGVEAKAALDAAREAGIVRAGGDTRLTTEAIGRLSVFPETQSDGDIEIKFFDSETGKLLTLEEVRDPKLGLTYEQGTVPGEIPTDKEIVEHTPEPTPDAKILVDSPAPNDLLSGTFHLYTDAEGHFTSLDPGDGGMLTRMNDAIQELARAGHGESPEAKFIFEQYTALLTSEGVEPAVELPPAQAAQRGVEDVQAREAALPEASVDDEPLRRFKGEAGKVKFVYDKDTGAVKDAFMPAYTPRPRDIEDALDEWGLTNKEVKAHFFEGASQTHMDGTLNDTSHHGLYPGVERPGFPIQSPENDYRQFVRSTERLSRQEALLDDMAENGYTRTPEYARLKMETETLEKYVAGNMTRQFNIKERGI